MKHFILLRFTGPVLLVVSLFSTTLYAGFAPYLPPSGENTPLFAKKSEPVTQSLLKIKQAIRSGNYAEAYFLWLPMAEKGDATAQYGIGWMYHNGYGLAINDHIAQQWWQKAANQGHIEASFSLGMLYHHGGKKISRNISTAIPYYQRAASDGHDEALLILQSLGTTGNQAIRAQIALFMQDYPDLFSSRYRVRVKLANMRQGPSTDYTIVKVAQSGDELQVIAKQDGWLLCLLEDQKTEAWISTTLVDESPLLSTEIATRD